MWIFLYCLYTSVERLFDFCFVFSYFSSVKCFLLCDLSKNFKVHCNAFEKSFGHLTFPHGKITWFETIDTSTKMFVIPTPWRLHKIVTDVLCLTSSIVVHLSERIGFAFSARKKTVFEILKTIKIFLKKHCLKMHETTCNGLVYLSACQKIKVKDHLDMLYDHYLLHISLKRLSSTIFKAEMLPWPIDLEIFFALKCMNNLIQEKSKGKIICFLLFHVLLIYA